MDIRTSLLATTIAMLVVGIAIIALLRSETEAKDLKTIGWSTLAQALAFTVLAARPAIPEALSIIIGNTVLLIGLAINYEAMCRFRGTQQRLRWIAWACPALGFMVAVYWGAIHPDAITRVAILLPIFGLMCLVQIDAQLAKGTRPRSLENWIIALSFVLGAASVIGRIYLVRNFPPGDPAYLNWQGTHALLSAFTYVVAITVCAAVLSIAIRFIRQQLERQRKTLAQQVDELSAMNRHLTASHDLVLAQQRALEKSSRMSALGQMAAGIAHEVNSPLGVIQSNVSSLTRYLADFSRIAESALQLAKEVPAHHEARQTFELTRQEVELDYLMEDSGALARDTQNGVARIKNITDSLVDFCAAHYGPLQRVDLRDLIKDTLGQDRYTDLAEGTWHVITSPSPQQVLVDPPQIRQALTNLLDNALAASTGRGPVTIRMDTHPEVALVNIEDTGPGIAKDIIGHLFEPFQSTKPVGSGQGLGLAQAYGIFKQHGGNISATNLPDDAGASFTVSLPLAHSIEGESKT